MNGRWRLLRWLLLAVVLAVLVRFVVTRRGEVASSLSHLSLSLFVLMGVLETANNLLNGYRLYLIAREEGERVTLVAALRLYLVGRFLNSFMPQSGNLYRGVRFKQLFSVGYTHYAGVLAAFTWLSLVTTVALAAVILAVGPPAPRGTDPLAAVLVLLVVLLAMPVAARVGTGLATRVPLITPLATRAHALARGLVESVLRPRLLVPFLLSTVLSFGIWIVYYGAAFRGLGVTLDPGALAVVVCLVRLGSLITLTPGNVGLLELASGGVVSWLGYSMADGVLATALVRALALTVNAVLALLFGWPDVVSVVRGDRPQGRVR